MCRKPKRIQPQLSPPQQTNFDQIESATDKSDKEESVDYISNYRELSEEVYDSKIDCDSDNYNAANSSETAIKLEPLNA